MIQIWGFPGLSPLLLQNPSSQVCSVIIIYLQVFQLPKFLLSLILCGFMHFFLKYTSVTFYWDLRKEQRLMHIINPSAFTGSQSDVL